MTPSPTPTAMATAAPATSPSTSLCLGFGSSSTDGWPAEPEQPPARCRWGTCCELPVGYVQLPVGIAGPLLLDGCQLPSSSSRCGTSSSRSRHWKSSFVLRRSDLDFFPSFIGCLILGSMKETRRMVFHGGRWCDLHGSAAMAWEPEYLRTCINENPGCLFITTNRDPTRLMTSAQEWSGLRGLTGSATTPE
ncbi:uncharacterized protein [Miscanthus floridulus]|uniref:uncharacterized protein isoform X2 n=1 Tax=Miscanthus floridulus TaxID=154761 RepID=UPI0034587AEE